MNRRLTNLLPAAFVLAVVSASIAHDEGEGPDKIRISAITDAPDPASPNSDGRREETTITVEGTVRPTDGLKSQVKEMRRGGSSDPPDLFFQIAALIEDPVA